MSSLRFFFKANPFVYFCLFFFFLIAPRRIATCRLGRFRLRLRASIKALDRAHDAIEGNKRRRKNVKLSKKKKITYRDPNLTKETEGKKNNRKKIVTYLDKEANANMLQETNRKFDVQ